MKKSLAIAVLTLVLSTHAAQAADKLCSVDVEGQKMTMGIKLTDKKGSSPSEDRVFATVAGKSEYGQSYAASGSDSVGFYVYPSRNIEINGTIAGVLASPELMKTLIYQLSLENSLAKYRDNNEFSASTEKSVERILTEALKKVSCQDL